MFVCVLCLIGDVVVMLIMENAHSVCVFESIVFKIHCLTPFGVRLSLNRLQHSSRIFVLTALGTESELNISFTKGSSSSTFPLTFTIVGWASDLSVLEGTVVDLVALKHDNGFSKSSSDLSVLRRAIFVDA